MDISKVIYQGILDEEFINDVRQGKYPVKEGVVCKGGSGHNLWMTKIKTLSWIEEVKKKFARDWERYVL